MYINRGKHSLDDKGRLIIPKKSILTKENDILFVRENSLTFSLYNIDEYNKLLEELKLKKSKAIDSGNSGIVNYINDQINRIMVNILGGQKIDSQNRLVILENVRKMYEIKKSVILCNGYKHIKVFRDEEKFDEYRKKLINIISMRQQ